MLKTLALAFLLLICAIDVDAQNNDLQILLSNFQIAYSEPFSDHFGCNYDMKTPFTVSVSNNNDFQSQSNTSFYPLRGDSSYSLDSAFNFSLNSNETTILSISIEFNITCRTVVYPDRAILLLQYPNSTNIPFILNVLSVTNNFNITASYRRECISQNAYGYNCNTKCTPFSSDIVCYNCDNDGNKYCCNYPDIDKNTCENRTIEHTTLSTSNQSGGNNSNSNSKEKLFMWIMIGLAIILFILIVIIVIALFAYCCRQPSKVIVAPAAAPQYMPPVQEQARPLPPYEYSNNYRKSETPQSRRNTHVAKPTVTREWDDESLASDWVEPQPRRVAQNAAVVSRNNSSRIIEEPLDIVV